jgi:hypothetical protein
MSFSDHNHEVVNAKPFDLEIPRERMRKCDAKFIPAVCHRLFDLSGVVDLKIERHLGILCSEFPQGRRKDVLSRNHDGCQIQSANDYFPQLGSFALGDFNSFEQFVGMTVKKDARFRQVDAPSDAAKKRDSEFDLQLVDLIRYVGLAHLEFLGSPGKARMPGNGLEYSESCYGDCRRRIRTLGLVGFWHSDSRGRDRATSGESTSVDAFTTRTEFMAKARRDSHA